MSQQLTSIIQYLHELQDSICQHLEHLDGYALFKEDAWERPEGGGGRSRVIRHGAVFEKGGVNFSHVHGPMPEHLRREGHEGNTFDATGVSLVIHPLNPYVPIIHMNVRYFETDAGLSWFGGGIDLTPSYPFEEDVLFFHSGLKKISDDFNPEWYPKYKKWCDEYFYIKHRHEMRGVGGIFYDYLKPQDAISHQRYFEWMQAVGNSFNPLYGTIVERRKGMKWGEKEKFWQKIRRGRYAEFNLVYDRGTKFGLETNGRIESILMSLPPEANWEYNHQPEANSAEAEALKWYQPQPLQI